MHHKKALSTKLSFPTKYDNIIKENVLIHAHACFKLSSDLGLIKLEDVLKLG